MKKSCIWWFFSLTFCFVLLILEANGQTCRVENVLPVTDPTNFANSTISTPFISIVTNFSFSCCGNVTGWETLIMSSTTQRTNRMTVDFQVWRRSRDIGDCSYTLVGNNTFVLITVSEGVRSVNVSTDDQIAFQTDDFIGVQVYRSTDDSVSNSNIMYRNTSDLHGYTRGLNVSQSEQRISSVLCESDIGPISQVPVITAMVEPTPCPSTDIIPSVSPSPTTPPNNQGSPSLSRGSIIAIAIVASLAVLLCIVITGVCVAVACVKNSKRRKPKKKKTYGKARFIRSLYILPKRYTSKENVIETTTMTGRDSMPAEEGGAEQGAESDSNNDAEPYINPIELYASADPLTEQDDDYYENNPISRKDLRRKEREKEKEKLGYKPSYENQEDFVKPSENRHSYMNQEVFEAHFGNRHSYMNQKVLEAHFGNKNAHVNQQEFVAPSESKHSYMNKQEFVRPSSLPDNPLQANELDTSEALYVNTVHTREISTSDSPVYVNANRAISTSSNKAYGVTKHSEDEIGLHQDTSEVDNGGEDEYVYVDVEPDAPEEVYEEMASFDTRQQYVRRWT